MEALVLSGIALYPVRKYRQVPDGESEELFLDEGRELSPMSPMSSTDVPNHTNQISPSSDVPNHHQYNKISTASNQKPYIPGK